MLLPKVIDRRNLHDLDHLLLRGVQEADVDLQKGEALRAILRQVLQVDVTALVALVVLLVHVGFILVGLLLLLFLDLHLVLSRLLLGLLLEELPLLDTGNNLLEVLAEGSSPPLIQRGFPFLGVFRLLVWGRVHLAPFLLELLHRGLYHITNPAPRH